jgi:hypothetical protein
MRRELMSCLTISDDHTWLDLLDKWHASLSCRHDEDIEISEEIEFLCREICYYTRYISDTISLRTELIDTIAILFVSIREESSFLIFTCHLERESIEEDRVRLEDDRFFV